MQTRVTPFCGHLWDYVDIRAFYMRYQSNNVCLEGFYLHEWRLL